MESKMIKNIKGRLNKAYDDWINRYRFWEMDKLMGNKEKMKLLDIGCGQGTFLNVAEKREYEVEGIDSDNFYNKRIKKISFEKYKTNKKYDVVVLYHLIEHVKNPNIILEKVRDLLTDGGLVVMETPLIGNLSEKLLSKKYFAYHDKSHISLMSKRELKDLIAESGFKIISKGVTLYQFPLNLIRVGFGKNMIFGFLSVILFIPFKVLQIMGLNDEIIRYYLKHEK